MRIATKSLAILVAFVLATAFALTLTWADRAYADMLVRQTATDEAAQAPEEKVELVELNLIQSGHYKPASSEVALKAQDDEFAMTDAQADGVRSDVSSVLSNWNGAIESFESDGRTYEGIKIDIIRRGIKPTDDNRNRIAKIAGDYIDDHPELFFLSGECYLSYGETYYTGLYLLPSYPIEDIPEMRKAYAEKVDEAVSWVGDLEVATDVDKAKAVHDYLVKTCYYNDSAARAGHPNAYGSYDPWNAYGALVLGEPVCQGYSLAFKACMSEGGVDSVCVSQWIGRNSHEWNKLRLGDSWYNLDVAFDDILTDGTNGNQPEKTPDVSYFLKSDEWFKANPDENGFHGPSPAWDQPVNVDAVNTQYDDAAANSWPEFDGSLSSASIKSFELATSNLEIVVGETATVQIGTYTPAWLNSAFVAGQATWSLADGSSDVIDINDTGAVTAKAPGTATVVCTISEHQQTCIVKVAKARIAAENTTIILSASQYSYNGTAREPGVTVMLGGQALVADTDYTVSYSNNKNVGKATVTINAKGDYLGTVTTTFDIARAKVTPTVSLSKASFVYSGKVQKPTLTVKVGGTELKPSSYDVAFSTDCKAAGSHKVTVTLRGNYSGSTTATFDIAPAKTTPAVTLSKASFVYSGKVQKPTLTVKVNGSPAAYNAIFSSGCKAVGSYKVTVKLKGNYSGSKTLKFKILPKGTSISKLKAKSRGFTAKWAKQAAQTTGYQVQYSLKSTFKKSKTLTIAKNKTVSKKVVKLKANKKYFVRVRTYKKVGTVMYCSVWSKHKAVITKK